MKRRMLYIITAMTLLLIIELGLRVIIGDHWYMFHDCGYSPYGAGDLLPDRTYIDTGKPDLPFRIITNHLGTRNKQEYTLKKPRNGLRLLALGDSITFGVHVNNQDSWPQRLESLLRQNGRVHDEVFNCGIVGYTISDEYLLLKEKAIHFNPDLIIVAFYANDLQDFSPQMRSIFQRRENGSSFMQKLKYTVKTTLCHSAIFCYLAYLRYQWQRHAIIKRVATIKGKYHEAYEQDEAGAGNRTHLQDYLGYVDKLATLAASRHIPVMFVFFPNYAEIARPQAALENAKAAIIEELASRHIPSLDLLPALRRAGNAQSLYLLPEEWHMNRYGYMVAARAIYGFLCSQFPEYRRPASEQGINEGRAGLAGND